jgi:HSP20 family protein
MSLISWKKDDLFPYVSAAFDDFWGKNFFKGIELGTTIPAANVSEKDDQYIIEMALPGGKKEDFDIHLDRNILTISSEKRDEKEEKKDGKVIRKEFNYNSFERSFTVPDGVDVEKVDATYENGLLRIAMKKLEPVKREMKKQILVQ